MIFLDPLRDAQREPPADYCRECGAELYGEEHGLCPACERRSKSDDIRN